MLINSKFKMYKLLAANYFGNRFRVWDTEGYKKAVDAGFQGLVGVRSVGNTPGLPYYHHKTYEEALKLGAQIEKEHGCAVRYYEASPDEHIILQGEFVENDEGPVLEWSTKRTHMRAALALQRNIIYGPGARLLLKKVLSEGSYEDFLALGELFPRAVIEFTVYEIFVGNTPGRNAVIWECRHY